MRKLATAVVSAAVPELRWMKNVVGWAIAAAALLMLVVSPLESHYFPVLNEIRVHPPHLRPDGWLCWKMHLVKTREARAVYYIAQVFRDDSPNMTYRGIDHDDGTPYGGKLSGTPPGHYDTSMCINASNGHVAPGYYRLGIRVLWRFSVPNRPYELQQKPLWIDYFPDKDVPEE